MATTDAKDEKGVEISVAREYPAHSVQSKFQREKPEGRGEGYTSDKRIRNLLPKKEERQDQVKSMMTEEQKIRKTQKCR